MPARSMTGFGASERDGEHGEVRVEVRAVNHRFLDVHLNLPSFLVAREAELKAAVARTVRRARVDVWVTWEPTAGGTGQVAIDRQLLGDLHRQLTAAADELGATDRIRVESLCRFPDVVRIEPIRPAVDDTGLGEIIGCLDEALGRLDATRVGEGEALVGDIAARVETLAGLVTSTAAAAAAEPERIAERLRERVQGLLGDGKLDPVRLHQEVAFLVDRADVSEELTRLEVHLDRARKLIAEGGEIGKPLDFLVQELGREANTLGSKLRSPEVAGQVLAMKAEIEKIREQARNLE